MQDTLNQQFVNEPQERYGSDLKWYGTKKNKQVSYFSDRVIKVSGNIVEIKRFACSFQVFGTKRNFGDSEKKATVYSSQELKDRAYRRASSTIRDLVNSNCFAYKSSTGRPYKPVFVTLTFRDNLTDLTVANRHFTSFIRSLFSRYSPLGLDSIRYLAVPEFQKRGAVHYHVIFFNLPFRLDFRSVLTTSWSHGFVQFRAVDNVNNVGLYISKYLSKDLSVTFGSKSYFCSKHLIRPLRSCAAEIVNYIQGFLPSSLIVYQKNDIPLDFLGSMDYIQYDLTGRRDLRNIIFSQLSDLQV